ncbi:hypothetical protein FHS57_005139 [Runella defluvii]|uniref:Uncharacterized protein n=1 Tax=Runella defluvii TaxID=370973 RepID=A0A7W5ZQ99_9BACT|nr:hypothetical protein [Runella defluvii]MBB3841118.1 hypothetical protein [Runella defluvii]
METQNNSFLDAIMAWFQGEKVPEFTFNISIENQTLLKLVGYSSLLIVGAIALNQWLLRATLKRFFGKN